MSKSIKVIPIGGLGQIGKNMTAIGYDETYILVDAGIAFPDQEMLGVDTVIPDFNFVRKNKKKVKGLFITHGHEDHIGAVPYFVKEFPHIPIFATELVRRMILNKLKYHKLKSEANLVSVNPDDEKKFGEMNISFFRTVHSIFDSVGIVVKTPLGNIVHTGDFKFDYSPINKQRMDMKKMMELSNEGVKLLISDSTNAEKPGSSLPESTVAKKLEKEMRSATKKTIVSTFSSSLPRIQSIFTIAENMNKRVAIIGKSMKNNIKIANELEFIHFKEETLISEKNLDDIKDEELVIIATGAQGERLAGLYRLANEENHNITLNEGDTVILSSGIVPGNEKQVGQLKNKLVMSGANVIQTEEIHTSGHGFQEELKAMINIFQPECFLPVHGEQKMLIEHKKIALNLGIEEEKTFICNNGDVLEINENGGGLTGAYNDKTVMIDKSGVAEVDINVLRDRKRMSEQGVLIVDVKVFTISKEIKLRFDLKGVAVKVDKTELKKLLKKAFEKRLNSNEKNRSLNRELINDFSDVVHNHIKRRPLIIPMVEFIKH